MVRREGIRFGISTNHKVNRLPVPYKHIHAQQNVVIKTELGTEGRNSKKLTKLELKRQLQKDTFNTHPDETSQFLRFSLNKAKRWEVIEDIKDESRYHSNHYIITEHHMLHGPSHTSSPHACVEVFNSSVEDTLKAPRKKYANVTDLVGKNHIEKISEDLHFGKKNCRRSRRRRAHREEEKAQSLIQYDVNRAAPRETYQTYSKFTTGSESRHRNSRNRSRVFHQCRIEDDFYDDLYLGSDFCVEDEGADYQEVAMETNMATNCVVTLETLVGKSKRMGTVCDEPGQRTPPQSMRANPRKGRLFVISKEDVSSGVPQEHVTSPQSESVKEEVVSVAQEKPSIVTEVQAEDITEENLKGRFGDRYMRGQCMPRRFAINISDSIIRSITLSNAELSTLLEQTGHHIFTIIECSLDPWAVMRGDGRLVEKVRVKVCGVDEGEEALSNALTNLESDDIKGVIDAVSQSVALLPTNRYLVENELPCQAVRPALVMETLQAALGWQYHTTNANKAVQAAQTKDTATGSCLVPQGASNTCESCSICYTEFDEDNQGTALTACCHWFCNECWSGHLCTQINQGNINIACPEYKCTTAVDKVTLMSLVPSTLYARYHANQMNSTLMLQSQLQWCPSPHCSRLVHLSNPKSLIAVNCECGMLWCSECKEDAHWPATCEQAKLYRDKAQNLFKKKDEGIRYVKAKPCPKCHYPIEKYHGCSHMECKCGHSFCWDCGQHAYHFRGVPCKEKEFNEKKYRIPRYDIVETTFIHLAVRHHKERTRFALHRRTKKISELASQMLETVEHQSTKHPDNLSTITLITNKYSQLQTIQKVLVDVAKFLSEAEFVLEHLVILLSSSSHGSLKRALFEHKMRLHFITGKLHKLFKEEANMTVADAEHLLNCGRDCLKWIALSTTRFSDGLRSPEE